MISPRLAVAFSGAVLLLSACGAATPAAAPTSDAPSVIVTSEAPHAAVDADRPLDEQWVEVIQAEDLVLITAFVEAGADVNADLGRGVTPLMAAAMAGNAPPVAALLELGADVTLRTSAGDTALIAAARGESPEVVTLLLEAGSDPDATTDDRFGSTALQIAGGDGKLAVMEALLDGGADIDFVNTNFGATALQVSAFYGEIDAVQLLIDRGADLHHRDLDDHSAVTSARLGGNDDVANHLVSLGVSE